jgi:hypothetical protein
MNKSSYGFLSAGKLKLLACILMVIDHIGFYFFPESILLRAIGRLAFPIFAFFIAEGCRFTRNKLRYFLQVFAVGLVCALAFYFYTGAFEGNILLTFSCSILLIYTVQMFKQAWAEHRWARMGLAAILFVAAGVGVYLFNRLMMGISYGIFGAILPLTVSVTDYEEGKAPAFFKRLDHPLLKMGLFAIGLVVIAAASSMKVVQSFSLLALIPLSMYNGKGGSKKLKWWFYAFYPAHLVVIWLIGFLINGI